MTAILPEECATAIAVVGMAGRFPHAPTLEAYWELLREGREAVTFMTDAELDPAVSAEERADPNYIRARGVLEDADLFDAKFFGVNPREALLMDPQQRLMLELAWEALEDAGYDPEAFDGLIGVYAGMSNNTYWSTSVAHRRDLIEKIGDLTAMTANEKDYLATRVSYKLNLRGPSLNIYTACSTALVGVCNAYHGLLSYQCDMALAGGISVRCPQHRGFRYQEGGILSADGHCRPFDVDAAGTVFSSGGGLVVLRRLADAVADGDTIHAVIRGAAMNNDGADRVSFAAPSVSGQAEVIAMAHAVAGVTPDTISYVEAHGTATPLGDPIEITALTQAFRRGTDRRGFCSIGSVKSNIGHTDAAAGIAGLLKVCLALKHQTLPPSLHFRAANPRLGLDETPFYVQAELAPWQANGPRRAGVSAFGTGGTNAHVIVEEWSEDRQPSTARPRQALLLSARTPAALDAASERLARHFASHPDTDLADAAYTLQRGRRAFAHRRVIVAGDVREAEALLQGGDGPRRATRETTRRNPPVVFMFPGQGAQYVGMGRDLYAIEPVFRAAIDEGLAILDRLGGPDLREPLLGGNDGDQARLHELLRQTSFTQPALFLVGYALARLWISWGVRPEAMIGHSVGEFVAACLAGIFSLEDALKLVATRGRLMQELPGGSMLTVRLPAETIEPRLDPETSLAAINGASLCVVSGPTDRIEALQAELEREDVRCRLLQTSHAFHSPMMEPAVQPFAELVGAIRLQRPTIPVVSTATGSRLSDAEALDPAYWARHLRLPVRFAEGVKTLWEEDATRVLLELGPRATCTTLARQQAGATGTQLAIPSLGDSWENQAEYEALLVAAGRLWLAGVAVDWDRVHEGETRRRVSLPTYPFERERFWLDPAVSAPTSAAEPPLATATPEQEPMIATPHETATEDRHHRLIYQLTELLADASGLDLQGANPALSFFEIGLDSLFLTQASLTIQKAFGVEVTFRQLLEEVSSLDALARYLDERLPPEPELPAPTPAPPSTGATTSGAMLEAVAGDASLLERVIREQLAIMTEQLEMIRRSGAAPAPAVAPKLAPVQTSPDARANGRPGAGARPGTGPAVRIETTSGPLTRAQQEGVAAIVERYTAKTAESKRLAQRHRAHLADPRTVSGFRPFLKEMVYPIVTTGSSGVRLRDVDGNEYIDLTSGFGLNFLGFSPPYVVEAIRQQLDRGFEIGPQTPLAGEVAELIAELTGHERVAFCNTGSEAVLAACRVARTVTGRSTIAYFTGDYHGIFDEVLFRGFVRDGIVKTAPGFAGIVPEMGGHVIVLDYGDPASLEVLAQHAEDLAAVLVEPVQSRHPALQPREFLVQLRERTTAWGTALIFDEVITGFRAHPQGVQGLYGIRADVATYGKVVGGGMPIGVVAGSARFLDALDGGFWQFGDASVPEHGVTFFAGTFVRHPLALAAAKAVLTHLKAEGPRLQERLNATTAALADRLNQWLAARGSPLAIEYFASMMYLTYPAELSYMGLLFPLMRDRGIHVWEGRNWFLTAAHTAADLDAVFDAFTASVEELERLEFLPHRASTPGEAPPRPGARLGRDADGTPAWFVPDPDRPGKYLQVESGP